MKKSILSQFATIGAGSALSMLIGLFTTPIITRLVDPDIYGQVSIFTMYSGIFLMILCIGLDQSLVRFYYSNEGIEYRSFVLHRCSVSPILLGVLVASIFCILAFCNVSTFEFEKTEMVWFSIYLLFQIINRFSILVIRLEYHFKWFSLINILYKLFYVFFALVLLKFFYFDDLFSLLFATVVPYVFVTLASIFLERKVWFGRTRKNFSNVTIRELIKYGTPFILSMGISTIFQYLDKIFLNFYCGYDEVGIYASALTLISVFSLIQSMFNTVWAPISVEHYEQDHEDKAFFRNANKIITVIMFGIGILLIACKDIFVLLLGEQYREASTIIPFLIFNPIMYTISETTVGGIVFMKKSKMHIYVAASACVVNLIGNWLLVPILEGKGAAISTGISYIVFFTMRTLLSERLFRVHYELKKFYVLTTYVIFYALYNIFFKNLFISWTMCLIGIVLLVFLYRETMLWIISYIRATAFNKEN